MKLFSAILLALSVALPGAAKEPVNPKPFTAPELRQWKGGAGSHELPAAPVIAVADASLRPVAEQLAADLQKLDGTKATVVNGKKGDITLALKKNKALGTEGYTLTIDRNVAITAPQAEGVRWGAMSLLQMLRQDKKLAKGTATDWPDYEFRAFMMDSGRKFIPLDYLYALVDDMAYYKLNKLHIHLNDNGFKYYFDDDWDKTQAAFRLESETYPGLTARDGSYTKQEFRDLQKYAAERGVEIIPEIDVPAHSLAFTRYMPEIMSTDGVNGGDHLNIDSPKTYEFLDGLLTEYLEGPDPVFTGPRFHIGTDEYQGDSLTMEKFRAFTDRYVRFVEKFGKTPVIWGSLTHAKGKTPVKVDGVEMYLWSNGYANPKDMVDLGYKVVSIPDGYVYIVPKAGYYRDYLDNKLIYEKWTPANVGGVQFEERHPQFLGGSFAVWNDHPNNGLTVSDIHHRVMSAIPAYAAKTWDGADVSVPYDEFAAKAPALGEAPGVNRLARYTAPGTESTVVEMASVKPGTVMPLQEVGYNYTAEFDIDGAQEKRGTVLFESPDATLWLSDPVTGNIGYSRDGHLNSFRYDVRPGEKSHVKIEGDNQGVKFYVNGKLVDNMSTRWYNYDGKHKIAEVRTLMFPLGKAGDFRSRISNLKVTQH